MRFADYARRLLPKPPACHGCPWFGDGFGYVPDTIREDAEVLILGQNPGDFEERGEKCVDYGPRYGQRVTYLTEFVGPRPLIGPTGFVLERDYLPVAQLSRERVSLANVIHCRQQLPRVDKRTGMTERTNEMPTGKAWEPIVKHCTEAHLKIPPATRLVVAMGAHAARFMGLKASVSDWRGFLLP